MRDGVSSLPSILPQTNFTKVPGVTDANGVAFIRMHVNVSGTYGFIWNMTYSGETDVAEFSQVVPFEVKTFNAYGSFASNTHLMKVVNFTRNASTGNNITVSNYSGIINLSVVNVTVAGSPAYIAFWNESTMGELISDGFTYNHYMALRNVTESPAYSNMLIPIGSFSEFVVDNDNDLNTTTGGGGDLPCNCNDGFSPYYGNISDTFGTGQPPRRDIFATNFAFDGNRSSGENNTQLLFAFSPQGGGSNNWITINSLSQSVAVRACASTFDRPMKMLAGANVTMKAEIFTNGPPVTQNLTIIDPFTGQNTNSILTGPSGCATFNVSRPGGWSTGPPSNIKGTVTYGANTENLFVGSLNVYLQQ